MKNIEKTLQEYLSILDRGESLEGLLTAHPDMDDKVQKLLDTAILARSLETPSPAPETINRGRAKVLNRAAQLRSQRSAIRTRAFAPFQKYAMALALTILFIISGTGIVRAASDALPGENLYPIKRGWENLQLSMISDVTRRMALAGEFENERLKEVNNLFVTGRRQEVSFAGVVRLIEGKTYISGIRVVMAPGAELPENGLEDDQAVMISGWTDSEGHVEAKIIEPLENGRIAPMGQDVEIETESQGFNPPRIPLEPIEPTEPKKEQSSAEDQNGFSTEFHLEGRIQSMQGSMWVIDGKTVYVQSAEILSRVSIGSQVEVEGYFTNDGKFLVTKVEVKEEEDRNESSGSGDELEGGSGQEGGGGEGEGEGDNGDSGGDQSEGDDHSGSSGDD